MTIVLTIILVSAAVFLLSYGVAKIVNECRNDFF